jgi:hypoxanthine phosphoribosyltransferase
MGSNCDSCGPAWPAEAMEVLLTADQIDERVRALAAQLQADYRCSPPVLVGVLTGSVVFLSDLMRHLHMPVRVEFMGLCSYGDSHTPGEICVTKDLGCNIAGQDVILVEDIVDTGCTLAWLLDELRRRGPKSLKVCALLDKPSRRKVPVPIDYLGFEIPDHFVVGYGLDYASQYRNLPYVAVLNPEAYGEKKHGN